MKRIHTKLARSIWLFDVRDLNPKGKDVLGDLVGWIKDAYAFAVAPDPDNPQPNTRRRQVPRVCKRHPLFKRQGDYCFSEVDFRPERKPSLRSLL